PLLRFSSTYQADVSTVAAAAGPANGLSTVAAAAPASTPAPPMSIRLRLLGVSIQAMVASLVEVRRVMEMRVRCYGWDRAVAEWRVPPRSGPGPVSRRRPPRVRPCLGSSRAESRNRMLPGGRGYGECLLSLTYRNLAPKRLMIFRRFEL